MCKLCSTSWKCELVFLYRNPILATFIFHQPCVRNIAIPDLEVANGCQTSFEPMSFPWITLPPVLKLGKCISYRTLNNYFLHAWWLSVHDLVISLILEKGAWINSLSREIAWIYPHNMSNGPITRIQWILLILVTSSHNKSLHELLRKNRVQQSSFPFIDPLEGHCVRIDTKWIWS